MNSSFFRNTCTSYPLITPSSSSETPAVFIGKNLNFGQVWQPTLHAWDTQACLSICLHLLGRGDCPTWGQAVHSASRLNLWLPWNRGPSSAPEEQWFSFKVKLGGSKTKDRTNNFKIILKAVISQKWHLLQVHLKIYLGIQNYSNHHFISVFTF